MASGAVSSSATSAMGDSTGAGAKSSARAGACEGVTHGGTRGAGLNRASRALGIAPMNRAAGDQCQFDRLLTKLLLYLSRLEQQFRRSEEHTSELQSHSFISYA